MKQVYPDRAGTSFLAKQINAARKVMLGQTTAYTRQHAAHEVPNLTTDDN
jgi:hypothetical protein